MTIQTDWNELDQFDRAILRVLGDQGRLSIADLSQRIGLSKSPTQARLKRLEQTGIITGYRTLVDPVRLGLELVTFVEVRLTDTREAALSAFNEAVAAIGEIEEAHMIAGNFDYLLKVRTGSMTDYRIVLAEKISSLPHVASTSSYAAMQAVKDDGIAGLAKM